MDVTELAWAAGFIDGEGHFGVHHISPSPRRTYRRITVRMTVGNVYRQPLDKLKDMFGGVIYLGRKPKGNHRGAWHWHLNGSLQCTHCAQLIQPFLVLKVDEARVFLQICEDIKANTTGRPLSPERAQMRITLSEQLRTLKHRSTGTPAEACQIST